MKKESQQEKNAAKKLRKEKINSDHKRIVPITKIQNKQVVKYF